jgi:hypothetical protein
MIFKIGEDAGKVYEYLRGKGEVSFASLVKGTKLKQQDADRAVGWLAREGKIRIDKKPRKELIVLTE